jgi:hypothetical protein
MRNRLASLAALGAWRLALGRALTKRLAARPTIGPSAKRQAPSAALLLCLAVLVSTGARGARAAQQPPAGERAAPNGAAPSPGPGDRDGADRGPRGRGGRGFGGPGGGPRVFGEVAAVRGDVLQIRTPFDEGLTRVILASDAQILRDETFTTDVLKPGMKVMGSGRQVEGTGTPTTPMKVEVQTLTIQDGGGGGPFGFGFGFGGRGGPLMRGQRPDIFRKQNYAGTISFDAQVKSVHPLLLVDDQGNSLPVLVASDVEVHQRVGHPIREGDITAGARVMAMGETTPDGLLNAHMVMLMGEGRGGSGRGSLSGIVVGINGKDVTVRPRFERRDLKIEVDPAAKVYLQETLDLDSIQVGDTLAFTGKVTSGSAQAPKVLVARTITPADEETPKIEEGGRRGFFGGFGGRQAAVTATVKGKVIAFEPLRVQTAEGREVTVKVPGQVAYVRYRLVERTALKAGQKVLFGGQSREGGLLADLIVLNPSLAPGGPGF